MCIGTGMRRIGGVGGSRPAAGALTRIRLLRRCPPLLWLWLWRVGVGTRPGSGPSDTSHTQVQPRCRRQPSGGEWISHIITANAHHDHSPAIPKSPPSDAACRRISSGWSWPPPNQGVIICDYLKFWFFWSLFVDYLLIICHYLSWISCWLFVIIWCYLQELIIALFDFNYLSFFVWT